MQTYLSDFHNPNRRGDQWSPVQRQITQFVGGQWPPLRKKKILCRSFIVSVLQISPCYPKGKGVIHKRVETAGVYSLVPLPGRQTNVKCV